MERVESYKQAFLDSEPFPSSSDFISFERVSRVAWCRSQATGYQLSKQLAFPPSKTRTLVPMSEVSSPSLR